jgi:hypothetical protein
MIKFYVALIFCLSTNLYARHFGACEYLNGYYSSGSQCSCDDGRTVTCVSHECAARSMMSACFTIAPVGGFGGPESNDLIAILDSRPALTDTTIGNGLPLGAYTDKIDCQIQKVQCLDNTSASIKFSGVCSREEIINEAVSACGAAIITVNTSGYIDIKEIQESFSSLPDETSDAVIDEPVDELSDSISESRLDSQASVHGYSGEESFDFNEYFTKEQYNKTRSNVGQNFELKSE